MDEIFKIEKNQNTTFSIVLESQQIIPGLGGILGKNINQILHQLEMNLSEIKKQAHFMIATSCNCHGVIHFMNVV